MVTPVAKPTAWRDGDRLVLRRNSPVAPDRCIFTNEPIFETTKLSRKLSWGRNGPGGAWLPTKFQMLWALADMKFVTVTVGVSGKVKATQFVTMVIAFAAVIMGAGLFFHGIKQGGVPPPLTYLGGGAALIVIALTLLVNAYAIVDLVSMDDEFIWLRGAKKPFLDSLPAFRPNGRLGR